MVVTEHEQFGRAGQGLAKGKERVGQVRVGQMGRFSGQDNGWAGQGR